MKPHQETILENLRHELHDCPEFAAHVMQTMTQGLQEYASLAQKRAADMEVVAAMALNARLFKGQELFIARKLRENEGRTSLNWSDQIDKLESMK